MGNVFSASSQPPPPRRRAMRVVWGLGAFSYLTENGIVIEPGRPVSFGELQQAIIRHCTSFPERDGVLTDEQIKMLANLSLAWGLSRFLEEYHPAVDGWIAQRQVRGIPTQGWKGAQLRTVMQQHGIPIGSETDERMRSALHDEHAPSVIDLGSGQAKLMRPGQVPVVRSSYPVGIVANPVMIGSLSDVMRANLIVSELRSLFSRELPHLHNVVVICTGHYRKMFVTRGRIHGVDEVASFSVLHIEEEARNGDVVVHAVLAHAPPDGLGQDFVVVGTLEYGTGSCQGVFDQRTSVWGKEGLGLDAAKTWFTQARAVWERRQRTSEFFDWFYLQHRKDFQLDCLQGH